LRVVHSFDPLWPTLNSFITGRYHLALVKNELEETVGIISIEDILEELLKREIVDETDIYVDIQKKIRVDQVESRKSVDLDDNVRETELV